MNCYFFDIKKEWEKILPIIKSDKVIEVINIFRWWHYTSEIGNTRPLIEIKPFQDDITRPKNSSDKKYVMDKLNENYNDNNPGIQHLTNVLILIKLSCQQFAKNCLKILIFI